MSCTVTNEVCAFVLLRFCEPDIAGHRVASVTGVTSDTGFSDVVFPIGIDVDGFTALTQAREAREMYERIQRDYSRRRLLLGVERLDYSKGLPQRLKAFRQLLQSYPENLGSATLIQIASPSREALDSYTDLLQELESLCGSINGDFGELDWMPVRYMHRNVARKRLPGLYRVVRVALVTPLRDGMNLVAKEYVACRSDLGGALLLSEFTGAAAELRQAFLCNPHDLDDVKDSMAKALNQPREDGRRHMRLPLLQRHP